MIIFNILRLSFRNFRNMKLRSVLTVLGIGIGIGTILFLVSFGQGLQRLLIKRITTAEALLTLDIASAGDSLVSIDRDSLKKLAELDAITEISPVRSERAKVNFEGVTARVTAHFIEDNYFRLAGLDTMLRQPQKTVSPKKQNSGNYPLDEESIVVSQTVLDLLSIKDDYNGKTLEVSALNDDGSEIIHRNYKIVNVVDDKLATSYLYLPASTYPPDKLKNYTSLKVQVRSTTFLESARGTILSSGFLVSALSDTVDQANKVFRIMQVILAIFGTIALMVAAIGMFNTMTIALLERTNEIGIMRAIGASRRDIWLLFLSESLLIGFLGGISGIAIGIGVAELANAGLNLLAARLGGNPLDVFYYPPWFVAMIVIFSTVVAFITGFYPAQRAAHLNPLDALRYK